MADSLVRVPAPVKTSRRGRRLAPPTAAPSKLDMLRLEERDVPAAVFTGVVYLDTNANGRFDSTPVSIPNTGAGSTTLATETGYSGLNAPWDPVNTRVPVTVTAFDAANAAAGSATTGLDGTYTLTVAAGGSYRLEFSNLPDGVSYGPTGPTTGTAVQAERGVVDGGVTGGVNLGLVKAEDVTPDNPLVATSIYFFGAYNDSNGYKASLVGFPYNSGAAIPNADAGAYQGPHTEFLPVSVPFSQVGATWGLAYDKTSNTLYAAAYTKAHAGYGPGTGNPATAQGQIYAADATPAVAGTGQVTTAKPLVNLEQLAPGSTGGNFRTAASWSAVPAGQNPYIRDGLSVGTGADGVARQLGWDAVGKTGLGGLDTDPTGRFLYTVALGDRKLYVIDTKNPTAAPQAFAVPVPAAVTGVTAANPAGDLRPFAVQYYRGSVYVGAVNSGESTISAATPNGLAASLNAFVFQFKLAADPAGNVTTGGGQFVGLDAAPTTSAAVLTVPLNYQRGYVQVGAASYTQTNNPTPVSANWNAWSPTYKNLIKPGDPAQGLAAYPQPMLTGLAFDTAGNVTLGFRDRAGDQFGVQTPADPADPLLLINGVTAGDTLRAFQNTQSTNGVVTGRWTLENNGAGPNGTPVSAQGVGNNQGPGGGEFYPGDYLVPGIFTGQTPATPVLQDHQEVTVGGVLQLPGYADVAVTTFDPAQVSRRYDTGGVRWLRNDGPQAGNDARAYELYQSASLFGIPSDTFAKTNGVGDLVALPAPAPVEIGNLVWADLNRNGRFDPTEPGLAGVRVVLFQGSNPVATATTDAAGNYFFTSLALPANPADRVPGKTYGVKPLVAGGAYQVRIPAAQPALAALSLTTAKISNGTENQRDSDATYVGADAVIPATAPAAGGAADHTFDAGFVYNLSIGDFVWNDLNNDGVFEPGEPALGGVTVQLLNADTQAVVARATTNAQGGYLFTGLNPGNYRVRIPLDAATNPGLQGFASSTGTPGGPTGPFEPADGVPVQQANNADSGTTSADRAFVLGPVVAATPLGGPLGEVDAPNGDVGLPDAPNTADANTYRAEDFGFYQPISIGDTVWVDANNNGTRDAGEPGLPGVTVQLLSVVNGTATVVGTTVTNAAGGYLFTNRTGGNYQVRLVRDAALAGYASSTGSPAATGPFEPVPGDPANDRDHGTEAAGFIAGPVISALPGLAAAVDPATVPAGLPADPAPVGSRYRNQDFGVFQPLQLGDLVFEDVNNDGVRQPAEPGVPNVVIDLLDGTGTPVRDAAGNPVRATTDANGLYLFRDLTPGQYELRFTPPAGYTTSTGKNASPTGPFEPGLPGTDTTNNADHGSTPAGSVLISSTPVTLVAAGNPDPSDDGLPGRANLRQDFGIFRRLTLGDFVWEDVNNNGRFDAGESPVGGVTVRLLDGANNPVLGPTGQPLTATTAADGGYLFTDLAAGAYRVEVVTPAGYKSSFGFGSEPVVGNPGNNIDHGTAVAGTGVVRGPVVTLTPGGAPLDDTAGPASATLLDGTTPNANSYRNQDFGFFRPLVLGDLVFNDLNNDGIRQPAEPGIAGVPVSLFDQAGTFLKSTTTDAAGNYLFTDLVPGTYQVTIVAPAGFRSSTGGGAYEPAPQSTLEDHDKGTETAGGVNPIFAQQVTLGTPGSAQNPSLGGLGNTTQDFGVYLPTVPPPPPPALAVGDHVWFDANNNGLFDTGELAAAGVAVRLLNGSGAVVASTVTDGTGFYRFSNLSPGVYSVELTAPAGYTSSTGGAGTPYEPAAQTNVNDADHGNQTGPATIRTGDFLLQAAGNPDEGGTANLRQDFGLISPPPPPVTVPPPPPPPAVVPASISGVVFVDGNINGVRDGNEPPIPGTRVYLDGVADDGTRVATSVLTDTAGAYTFTGLRPGTYTVREQQPDGTFYDGIDAVGTIGGRTVGTLGNDILSNVRLNGGDNGVQYNFSEIPTAATFGYVWVDANRNGVFDPGETPIPDVPVTISGTIFPGTPFQRALTAADVPGGLTVNTNSAGRYDFPTLPFGNYNLAETQPVQYDDWQLQDGDPNGPRPGLSSNLFTGVALTYGTPIRGPFNFGEVLAGTGATSPRSPQAPALALTPSKRDFLGSTGTSTGGSSTAAVRAAATVRNLPDFPGVVSAVSGVNLQPTYTAAKDVNTPAYVAAGAGAGTAPIVRVFDYSTGIEKFRFLAYEESYTGGVRTAVGDVTGDGIPDIVTATGSGGGPRIRVFDGVDGTVVRDFFALESSYTGGLSVTAADVTGDGVADIVVGTDQGGGPGCGCSTGRPGRASRTSSRSTRPSGAASGWRRPTSTTTAGPTSWPPPGPGCRPGSGCSTGPPTRPSRTTPRSRRRSPAGCTWPPATSTGTASRTSSPGPTRGAGRGSWS